MQENSLNGKRDMTDKVHCSPSKVPFTYRLIAANLIRVIGHDGWVLDMEFQGNPLSERRGYSQETT